MNEPEKNSSSLPSDKESPCFEDWLRRLLLPVTDYSSLQQDFKARVMKGGRRIEPFSDEKVQRILAKMEALRRQESERVVPSGDETEDIVPPTPAVSATGKPRVSRPGTIVAYGHEIGGHAKARREFIQNFARKVAAGFGASVLQPWNYVESAFGFTPQSLATTSILERHERDILRRIMFCDSDSYQIVAGSDHPNVIDGVHPDNALTAMGVLTDLLDLSPDRARDVPEITPTTGTKLGFGSPASYAEIADIFRRTNPFGLPVLYGEVDDQSEVCRFLNGKRHKAKRKGLLIDGKLRPVQIDSKRWQKTDDCLISVLPNVLDIDGLSSDSKLVLIGGAHGVGTRCFVDMFKNPAMKDWFFRNVEKFLRETPYFQAWFHVESIRHFNNESIGSISIDESTRGFRALDYDVTHGRAKRFMKTRE